MNEVDEIALLNRILKIEENIGSCTMDVHNKLTEGEVRFDTMEEALDELREASNASDELIREALVEINRQLADSKIWQDEHGKQEMEELLENRKILKSLVGAIAKIDAQTQNNTKFVEEEVQSRAFNEELEKRLSENIKSTDSKYMTKEQHEAMLKEALENTLWFKFKSKFEIMLIAGIATGALSILWNLIQLGMVKK